MSFESLLDHTCTIYRPTESTNALREKANSYASIATGQPLTVQLDQLDRQDEGAGEQPTGQGDGFMSVGANVQAEDVIVLTSGPESPRTLRVVSLTRPRGHHTELILEPFNGSLS